jgi:2-keto-4-pentenoate hydratase/2-oxohepta-3-ene-1,7-dioic acid hydratase in catechol pathway
VRRRCAIRSAVAREPGSQRSAVVAHPADEIEYLPAVYPSKILAIGRNYADHALEGGGEPPKAPLIFAKLDERIERAQRANCVAYGERDHRLGSRTRRRHRSRAKAVSEADALDYVFGYTLMNDVTARDLQRKDGQWTRGKGLDTFAPLARSSRRRDEILMFRIEGSKASITGSDQSSNTSKMIFSIAT